jgi:hypothetical protein
VPTQRAVLVAPDTASVMLYWLPLGAGGHSVRWNGRVFEAVVSRIEHRGLEICITPRWRFAWGRSRM